MKLGKSFIGLAFLSLAMGVLVGCSGAAAHSHSSVKHEAVEATCTEAGNSLYFSCEGCDKYFSDAECKNEIAKDSWVIAAKGHTMVHHDAVEATCTEKGNVEYYECSVCHKTFADQAGKTAISELEVAAKGHTLVRHEAVEATCTEAGSSLYFECSTCGKFFSDDAGRNEVAENSWVVAALGHDLVRHDAVAASCTEAGNSLYFECSRCGKFFSDAEGTHEIEENSWVLAANGHQLTKHDAVEATCTEAGSSLYFSCSSCGKFFSDAEGTQEIAENAWVVPALGHKMVHHDAVAATCTEKGVVEYYECSVCHQNFADEAGKTPISDLEVAAKGHSLEKHDATSPTCTEAGNSLYYSCSGCGKFFSDAEGTQEVAANSWVIAATGHNLTKHDAVAPTASENGHQAYWSCSVCNKLFSDAEGTQEIPEPIAITPSDVDWEHYSALRPTSTNPGSREYWVNSMTQERQLTVPAEHRDIIEKGAPTLETVQQWGALDDRYLNPFDPTFDYMSQYPIAWGDTDGTHVMGTYSASDFGIKAEKVNELIAAGYTMIAFDWSVDYASWADKSADDKLVFYQSGFDIKMLSTVTSGTVEYSLVADAPIIIWLQRDSDNNAIKNKEFVVSNVRLFNPSSLESKMLTNAAWTSTGALNYSFVNHTISAADTWSLYFSTTYAAELYEVGYRTMTATFTITKTTTDYLTTVVNNVVTSYKNNEAVYTLSFLLSDLKGGLTVRTNSADVSDGDHNASCTGNGIVISNITLSEVEDASLVKQNARNRLSKMFYSEPNCWTYFRHNSWGTNAWGPDCVKAVFGTEAAGCAAFDIQNAFLQDMKAAGYTKVTFRVQATSVTEGKTVGKFALYTQGGAHSWSLVYKEPNGDDYTFTLDLKTLFETLTTSDYLKVEPRPAGEASPINSIITLSNVTFSVGADEVSDASIKEFYTEKQVRRVEQQDSWKFDADYEEQGKKERGHAEYYKFGTRDVIHLSAHYDVADTDRYTYNSNWSEWRFEHQQAGLTSVTFSYLYIDSNTDTGDDGVGVMVHTMSQWYGATYQGRAMNLVADGEWHTITVTGDAYDINFFVMKIYHFTGDIYISNIIYA